MPTGKQIRAARVLVDWGAEDLAQRVGVSRVTIQNIEHGVNKRPRIETMNKIAAAFESMGVEFLDHDGVRRRPPEIEVFEGRDRFEDFSEYLFKYLSEHGGDVCVNAIDERLFSKYRRDHELHRKRMKELFDQGKITFRIIASTSAFKSEYAQYRHIPALSTATPVSFYAFGDCLALISFVCPNPPYIVLHKSGPLAKAYKDMFERDWERTEEVPHAQ